MPYIAERFQRDARVRAYTMLFNMLLSNSWRERCLVKLVGIKSSLLPLTGLFLMPLLEKKLRSNRLSESNPALINSLSSRNNRKISLRLIIQRLNFNPPTLMSS